MSRGRGVLGSSWDLSEMGDRRLKLCVWRRGRCDGRGKLTNEVSVQLLIELRRLSTLEARLFTELLFSPNSLESIGARLDMSPTRTSVETPMQSWSKFSQEVPSTPGAWQNLVGSGSELGGECRRRLLARVIVDGPSLAGRRS